ncbi:MTOR-associated protein MEAK7 isoform X2 [Pectinophora gossypiella]|uniref:MTOR-associated protein MEAK7 isoform X2 n=1 Tax=Pectinophora gossypiella TaxID=13191 RepID=UPI00214EFB95|nr:MTOR-associated protein MEAK7 isoform X2 [Pectinophora gossypiella]
MWNSFCRIFSPAEPKPEDSSMGNTSKKLAAKCALLTKDEQKYMASTFRQASRSSERVREEDLIKLWGPQIDPRLAQYLLNYLFGPPARRQPTCDFNKFAELYVYNIRGTVEEKMQVVASSLGSDQAQEIQYQLLREYCESIVSTYVRMIKSSNHPNPAKWIEKGFRGKASNVQALGETVAAGVHQDMDNPATACTSDQIYRWVQSNTLLQGMSELVFENLYGMHEQRERTMSVVEEQRPEQHAQNAQPSLLPFPEGIDPLPDYPAFIDLAHIVWLNSNLPRQHQHKWRFLFSSHIHGESFSTMAGRIQDVGPSLVIIEDNAGYIFGGYASQPWTLSPNFYGTDESFLFTLAPKMRVYPATSYNDHYQYMNFQTKTLPNGLMMGGQFDFGGIWVNADPFGTGTSTDACSTFRGYKRLSKETSFKIRSLEVWGVGDKPLSVKESDERDTSILDRNPEAKAILDMAGRTRHSEGIREPPAL